MIPDELINRLQYIEIYTRKAARHHWVADYRSPIRGRGFEFDQHKPYQQGDDYRQIDWNATARMPQPYIKKAYEEKEMNAYVMNELARGRQADLMAEADRGRLARIAREGQRGQHDARFRRAGKLLAAAATAAALLTAASAIVPH